MAESDISISEMTNGTFSAGALFPAIQPSQQSASGYSNVKMSGADIGDGIGQLQFPLRLETENKSIFGAINEAAKSIINFLPIDTASGSLASFPDGANDIPLKSLACTLNPVQSGSGDPSPSNIRPITGHDDVTITQKDGNNTIVNTTTITFPDTVYGASLNVETGVLTDNVDIGTLSTTDTWAYSSSWSTSNTNVFYTLGSHPEISFNSLDELSIVNCDYMPTGSRNDVFNGDTNMIGMSGGLTTGAITVRIDKNICADLTAFQQFITDHTVTYAYKKATPTITQLTPEQLNSILGDNNFYHDGNGQVVVTYRADIELYIDKKTS